MTQLKLDDIGHLSKSFISEIQSLSCKYEDLLKNYVSLDELELLKQESFKVFTAVNDQLNKFKYDISEIREKFQILTKIEDGLRDSKSLNKEYHEFQRTALENVKVETEKRLVQYDSKLRIHVNSIVKDIESKISDTGDKINMLSSVIESMKIEFLSKMEAIKMDAENAFLKSSNNAYQIQLMERRIENINLLLKKYELNK